MSFSRCLWLLELRALNCNKTTSINIFLNESIIYIIYGANEPSFRYIIETLEYIISFLLTEFHQTFGVDCFFRNLYDGRKRVPIFQTSLLRTYDYRCSSLIPLRITCLVFHISRWENIQVASFRGQGHSQVDLEKTNPDVFQTYFSEIQTSHATAVDLTALPPLNSDRNMRILIYI